jgi:hypothetical protein
MRDAGNSEITSGFVVTEGKALLNNIVCRQSAGDIAHGCK